MAPSAALQVHLQQYRERAHLSRVELAQRAGLSRQAIHAIETGATIPSTLAALQLARALGVAVEQLFTLPNSTLQARWLGETPPEPSARVQLAQVGEQWLAIALHGETGLRLPADGVTVSVQGERVQVTPLQEP